MAKWTKMRTWDPWWLPPQCTWVDCFVEALWIDPWNANYYCEVHKDIVISMMKLRKEEEV